MAERMVAIGGARADLDGQEGRARRDEVDDALERVRVKRDAARRQIGPILEAHDDQRHADAARRGAVNAPIGFGLAGSDYRWAFFRFSPGFAPLLPEFSAAGYPRKPGRSSQQAKARHSGLIHIDQPRCPAIGATNLLLRTVWTRTRVPPVRFASHER